MVGRDKYFMGCWEVEKNGPSHFTNMGQTPESSVRSVRSRVRLQALPWSPSPFAWHSGALCIRCHRSLSHLGPRTKAPCPLLLAQFGIFNT